MEFLIVRHEDDCWFLDSNVHGIHMKALYNILDAEGARELFSLMKETIIDLGQAGTGRNVTFVRIKDGIATMRLDPFVFGQESVPFQTDEKQFKYMIKEFTRLMEKKVPAIMITRDDNGVISVREQ